MSGNRPTGFGICLGMGHLMGMLRVCGELGDKDAVFGGLYLRYGRLGLAYQRLFARRQ